MKIVYTSIDDFKRDKWIVKSYRNLSQEFSEWIEGTTCKLLQNRTKVELSAGEELKRIFVKIYAQPFFQIHGRSYFLDYYIPSKRIAVEVDGKYHKDRKDEDKLRDADFRSIGIRTVRVKAKDVIIGKFLDVFKEKFFEKPKHKRKPKRKKVKQPEERNIIGAARKRLREHDRMKHNAKWI